MFLLFLLSLSLSLSVRFWKTVLLLTSSLGNRAFLNWPAWEGGLSNFAARAEHLWVGHACWVHLDQLPPWLQNSFDSTCAIWVSIRCYNPNDFPGWHNDIPSGNCVNATRNTRDSYPQTPATDFPFLENKSSVSLPWPTGTLYHSQS